MSTTRRRFLGFMGAAAAAGPVWSAAEGGEMPASGRFLEAVAAGDLEAVRGWLDRDAGLVHTKGVDGRSAFAIAVMARHAPVADLLRSRGHEPDLHESALILDWDLFASLAEGGADAVDRHHPIGGSAMVAAAIGGAGTSIWRVYAQGARPDARSGPEHATALRVAFDHPDLGTAEMTAATLLSNGADPRCPQPNGDSALHAAAGRGSLDLVEMLVRKGAQVDAVDAEGATASDRAEAAGHAPVVLLLRRHREIPRDASTSRYAYDVEGNPYRPPDLEAFGMVTRSKLVGVSHRDLDAVKSQVEAHPALAHAVATTTEGAVEACAHMGRKDIVDYLLEQGAPYSLPTAVMRGDLARAQALLEDDPRRIHERAAHDFALLWYPVIGGGLVALAELLLDAGAEVERQHQLGTTALHWATIRGKLDMMALLLDRGADPERVGRKFDPAGQTPLMIAEARDQVEAAALLRSRGAKR